MYTKTKLRRAQNINKFEEIYNKIATIYKDEFEKIVKKKNKLLWFFFMLIIVFIVSFSISFWKYSKGDLDIHFIMLLALAFIVICAAMCITSKNEQNFINSFKERIIGFMLKQMHPNLIYSPTSTHKKEILNNYFDIGFASKDYGTQLVDDEITGSIYDNICIRVSDLYINKHTDNGSTGLFQGLFLEIELDKHIDADIRLLLPEIHYLYNTTGVEKIEMDNVDFKKQFNVYTNNKLITHQILTSEVMDKLKNYYNNFNMFFELVIKNNKAYLRIETGPMFESFSVKNKLHKEDTFIYYSVLNFAFDLAKDIYTIIENTDI